MNALHDLITEPESKVTIRFQDCDPFGHLNNARFLDYFLNARMDHLEQAYGINIYDREKPMSASWVIKKTQIAYLRPAMLAETVLIRTRLIHFNETTIVLEALMLEKEARHLKALCWIEFAYINLGTGRPAVHEQEWLQLLNAVRVPDEYDVDGFNRRVEAARTLYRRRAGQEAASANSAANLPI